MQIAKILFAITANQWLSQIRRLSFDSFGISVNIEKNLLN